MNDNENKTNAPTINANINKIELAQMMVRDAKAFYKRFTAGSRPSEDEVNLMSTFGVFLHNQNTAPALNEADALRAEVEKLRMQVVGCGVIAMSNTRESLAKNRIMRPDYFCASTEDVIKAVEREIKLREDNESLAALVESKHRQLREAISRRYADTSDTPTTAIKPNAAAGETSDAREQGGDAP